MTKRKKVDIHEHFQRERQSRSGKELNGLIIIGIRACMCVVHLLFLYTNVLIDYTLACLIVYSDLGFLSVTCIHIIRI